MKTKRVRWGLLILVAFLLSLPNACTKSWSTMTSYEKAAFFNNFYLKNKKEYEMKTSGSYDFTDDEREVLRVKKQILVEMWPFLVEYNTSIEKGEEPGLATERGLLMLVNKFEEVAR